MIKFSEIAQKIVDFSVASTTAGTNINVAHNLGFQPSANAVRVQPISSSADLTDDVCSFAVVSTNATNVVLRPDRTLAVTVRGRLYIGLEEMGPVNMARP